MRLAKRILLAVSTAAFVAAAADATSVRSLSMRDMVGGAELVFEGRVLSVESRARGHAHAIETCATFEVQDQLKGPEVESPLELCFAGGSHGGFQRHVTGMRHPAVDDTGVWFVESLSERRVNPIVGWDQGQFRYRHRQGRTRASVTTAAGRPVLGVGGGDDVAEPGSGLSQGVARGARVGAESAEAEALSPDEFKAQLRALIAEVD